MSPLPFLKKKEAEGMVGKGFVPVDRVKELFSRGFSEPEIIDILRKEGFSPEEVDKALTEALKESVEKKRDVKEEKEVPKLPTWQEIASPKKEVSLEIPEQPLQQYYEYPTEDYIDAIVQARVSEVESKLREFYIRYEELTKKVENLGERLERISRETMEKEGKIISKFESLEEAIRDLSLKVGGLEKAFKETLPALIESVKALSDLIYKVKKSA